MGEYLNYVIRLRDRVANTSSQDGITKWALGVAILYLLFQALPTLAELVYQKKQSAHFIYVFVHSLGFVVGCVYLFYSLKSKSKFSIRDYRFKNLKLLNMIREFIASALSDGLYLWLNLAYVAIYILYKSYLPQVYVLTGLELYLSYFAAFMGAAYIAVLIVIPVIIGISNYLKPEFPFGTAILVEGDSKPVGLKLTIVVLIALLIFGNLFYMIFPSISMEIDIYKEALIFSMQLSIALVGASIFIKSINQQDALSILDKLERDIVLHTISENEIKLRLEEHFGYEINEFILTKITDVRDLGKSIETLLNEYPEFTDELAKIPPAYKTERSARIKEYLKKLKLLMSLNDKKCGQFIKFLERLLKEAKEEELILLIKNYKVEVESIHKTTVDKTHQLLDELEKLR